MDNAAVQAKDHHYSRNEESTDKQMSFGDEGSTKYSIGAECSRLYERVDPLMSKISNKDTDDKNFKEFRQLISKLERFMELYVKSSDAHHKICYSPDRKTYLHDFVILNLEIRLFYEAFNLPYSIDQFRNEDILDQRQVYKTAFFRVLDEIKESEADLTGLKRTLLTEVALYPITVAAFLTECNYVPLNTDEKQLLANDVASFKECIFTTFSSISDANVETSDAINDEQLSVSTVNEAEEPNAMSHPIKSDTERLRINHFLKSKLERKRVKVEQEIRSNLLIGTFHRRQKVFLKQFPLTNLQEDAQFRKKLEQEILLLKYLGSYPTILSCYGYCVRNPNIQIVYELAPYGSLDQVLRETRMEAFPISLILAWLSDISDSMEFLHGKGILHGDIRAQNIFVCERLQTKLGNFEHAKLLDVPLSAASLGDESVEIPGMTVPSDPSSKERIEEETLELPMILSEVDKIEVDFASFLHYALFLFTFPKFAIPTQLPIPQQIQRVIGYLLSSTIPPPLIEAIEELLNQISTTTISSEAIASSMQGIIQAYCQGDPRQSTHFQFRDIQIIESTFPSLIPLPNPNDRALGAGAHSPPPYSSAGTVPPTMKGGAPARLRSSPSSESLNSLGSISSAVSRSGTPVEFLRYYPAMDQQSFPVAASMEEDRAKLTDYLRFQVQLTEAEAVDTAKILILHGIRSAKQLQTRLLKSPTTSLIANSAPISPVPLAPPAPPSFSPLGIADASTTGNRRSMAKSILSMHDMGGHSPTGTTNGSLSTAPMDNWEILIEMGIDAEVALDIYRHFLSLRNSGGGSKKHRAWGELPPKSPDSAFYPSATAAMATGESVYFSPTGYIPSSNSSCISIGDGMTRSVLPSEIARLYASASLGGKLTSLEKLQTLAEDEEHEYNYYLANGFLMRMYALGQGKVAKDRVKAQQLATEILPWLQGHVVLEHETARIYIQYFLGVCYSEGLGDVPRDAREAVQWYRASADGEKGGVSEGTKGYSGAQAYLGHCYFHGLGVMQDYTLAVKYYLLAANAGHSGAQSNLGICYEKGLGVPMNLVEAFRWFNRAADQSDAGGLYNVGLYYAKGIPGALEPNPEKAYEYYLKAATFHHHTASEYEIGNCFYDGFGIEQNFPDAIQWYSIAAQKDYAPAQTKLALCYEQGVGVEQNYEQAVLWYQRATELGDVMAAYYLGFCYFNGWGVKQDYSKAVEYYRISAVKKYPPALNNMGFCYFHGHGVSKNIPLAAKYYQQSADLGYAPAQFNIAFCYERGLGVPKKLNLVIRYYRLAAEQGNQNAKQALLKIST